MGVYISMIKGRDRTGANTKNTQERYNPTSPVCMEELIEELSLVRGIIRILFSSIHFSMQVGYDS